MDNNNNKPPVTKELLWVRNLPDVVIETQVIYILLEAHTDIDIRQTLYSMWTYDNSWHPLNSMFDTAIIITQNDYDLLVINNLLVPGQQYIISDMTFTYNIGGTSIADTYTESLLVTALTTDTLLPIAYSPQHPNEYVEVDWSIPAITFRHDLLLNNHIGYDYRNKLNRRYTFNIRTLFVPNVAFDDWCLPSINALMAIKTHLYDETLGNLIDGTYLSSTETDATQCKVLTMSTGVTSDVLKTDNTSLLRPIRSFTYIEAVPYYSVGDLGPAGGYIFAIIDNLNGSFTYYEVSNVSLTSNHYSLVAIAIGTTLSSIESSLDNTLVIMNQVGFTTGAAQDTINYLLNSNPYSIGDVVSNITDDIYIALKDNLSTTLTDGNWYKLPFKNNTYSSSGETDTIVIYGIPYVISSDVNDYVDVLTFLGSVEDVTTGSDFLNNVFQGDIEMCKFGENNSYITSGECANVIVGDYNSYWWINNLDNVKIGNLNFNFYFDTIENINIGNDNTVIALPVGTHDVNIDNSIDELISSNTIINTIFESNIVYFINTVRVDELHVKTNINLSNLTTEVLTLLPLGFRKTIENMYHPTEDVKPMLYYYDADSSLPILVEIQQGN